MLRAVIIDDEQQGINNIKLLINKFTPDVNVVAEALNAAQGIELIENYRPEIVFLDIHMPHMNGFELLQKLSFREFSLIFTTAHEEYGLQAIKNNALDYLLKPVDVEDLKTAIEKVKQRLEKKLRLPDLRQLLSELNQENSGKMTLHTKEKIEYIDKAEIIRLESDSNYTYIYCVGNIKLCISKTMKQFEDLLCANNSNFMRVHNSHIVNLNHAVKFIKDQGLIVTTEDYKIPVSQNKREDFIKWLNNTLI